ncbi:MAG: AroM family protein [Anaerolineaceae bacterium]
MKTFGAVTIGQAPRPDITADILVVLGPDYRALERGALDGLTRAEINRLAPNPGEDVLVTRLREGSEVQAAERHITPLVQQKVNELFAEGVPVVLLLCTGHFPGFTASGPVLHPQELINEAAAKLGDGKRVGVLCPTQEHIPQMLRQWGQVLGREPLVMAVSPYHGMGGVEQPASAMKKAGVQVIAMDCIAYPLALKQRVEEITGAQILLPRTLAAESIRAYFDGE